MTSTQWEHQPEVRDALRTIVSDPQLGDTALSNSQTMSNLLKDLLPDAPRETSVLVAAAEAGLPQVLKDHVAQGMDVSTASSLTASALAARTPFTQEACTWVVRELAIALGLAPEGGPGQPGFGRPQAPLGRPQAPLGQPQAPLGQPQRQYGGQQAPFGQPQRQYGGQQAPFAGPQLGAGQPQTAFGQPPGQFAPPQGQFAQPQTQFGQPQGRFQQPQGQFGQPQGGFGAQTMPPTVGPGMATGPAGRPGRRRRVPRLWAFVTAGLVAVAAIIAVVVLVQQSSGPPPVEQVRKIIGPDVRDCRSVSVQLTGATAYNCSTKVLTIGMSAYQFDNASDYRAGLNRLNASSGWNASAAGTGCPPPSGKSAGQEVWHTIFNPKYKTARPDQILECYPPIHATSHLLYLWTLPTQRAILVAGDFSSSATFTDLQNWWKNLTYG